MAGRNYREKLLDPRWQKRRLEMLAKAEWKCTWCGAKDQTLHVHHGWYHRGLEPWDYADDQLHVICGFCHSEAHRCLDVLGRSVSGMNLDELALAAQLASAIAQQHMGERPIDRVLCYIAHIAGWGIVCDPPLRAGLRDDVSGLEHAARQADREGEERLSKEELRAVDLLHSEGIVTLRALRAAPDEGAA